jgi:hypothetical protein
MHPLLDMLLAAADGRFPPVDGLVEVMAPSVDERSVGDRPVDHAVVEFTGHSVVVTDLAPAVVLSRGLDGFGGSSHPDVLRWLAGPDGWIGSHDAVLAARGTGGEAWGESTDHHEHPRVVRSRHHRRDVRVHADDSGLITLGLGLVDRLEISVELFGSSVPGDGRRLIRRGLALVDAGAVVFAQVAPGNAASLRAFLSCGFVPIGAETLLRPSMK